MRENFEKIISFLLGAISWVLVSAGILLFFIEKTPNYTFMAYAVGIVLLFLGEYLSYDRWKRKTMSGEDAGQKALSRLLNMVVTGFAIPLILAAAYYLNIAKDWRVVIVLFMGYLAALVKLGFMGLKIFRAKDRDVI